METNKKSVDFLAYIHHKDGRKIGVMVADIIDNKIRIGYSKVRLSSTDVFDREFGLKVAYGRCTKQRVLVPTKLKETIERFSERAKKYFRDKTPDFHIVAYSEKDVKSV